MVVVVGLRASWRLEISTSGGQTWRFKVFLLAAKKQISPNSPFTRPQQLVEIGKIVDPCIVTSHTQPGHATLGTQSGRSPAQYSPISALAARRINVVPWLSLLGRACRTQGEIGWHFATTVCFG